MTHQDRSATAALLGLIVLQLIMLSALYAGIPPNPPVATPLFGIAPFIGAAIAAAVAAVALLPVSTGTGRTLSVLATLMALVSFGPQKYFDAQFALIWPAVIAGQLAATAILFQVVRSIRNTRNHTDTPPFDTVSAQ